MAHKKEKDLRVRVSDRLHKKVYQKAQSLEMNKSEYVRYLLRKEMDKQ